MFPGREGREIDELREPCRQSGGPGEGRHRHGLAGWSRYPPGKIAAVVTSLQMLEPPSSRPPPASGNWRIRHVEKPDVDWYRDLFRNIGEDWLWFSRLVANRDDVEAIIQQPEVEIYALVAGGADEGLLELDLREQGECELAFFGIAPQTVG